MNIQDVKLCVNCSHYDWEDTQFGRGHVCTNTKLLLSESAALLVTGACREPCQGVRAADDKCGVYADWFEPAPVKRRKSLMEFLGFTPAVG